MKIRLSYPKGSEGWEADLEMDYVPRVEDSICLGDPDTEPEYYIRHVMHTPNEPDFQVFIVLKP